MAPDDSNHKNAAAWLHGVDDLRVEPHVTDLSKPLQANEVRVKVGAVGICGSDVHYLKHMRIADFVVRKPMVIGHEAAGIVSEVGPGVTGLSCGDRIALEPGIPCRSCEHCKGGSYNLCELMAFHATPPVHGSLARFITHPADFCFKLPEEMTLEEGAMCEPVSVGVHACRRAKIEPGQAVAILGAGPIGLVTLMVAKAFGAAETVVTDISDDRLKVASELGADFVANVRGLSPEEAAARIVAARGGGAPKRPDACVDCCGFESSVATALAATKSGGRVCIVGMAQLSHSAPASLAGDTKSDDPAGLTIIQLMPDYPVRRCSSSGKERLPEGHDMMRLPVTASAAREVDVVGVFRYRNAYPTAIKLISSGAVNCQPLITHRFSLAEEFSPDTIKEGFKVSAGGGNAIKVMFDLVPDASSAGPGA